MSFSSAPSLAGEELQLYTFCGRNPSLTKNKHFIVPVEVMQNMH